MLEKIFLQHFYKHYNDEIFMDYTDVYLHLNTSAKA